MDFHVQCQDKTFMMISSSFISPLFLAFYCDMDMSILYEFHVQGPNNHLQKNLIDHLNIFEYHVQQIFQPPYKLSDFLECIHV
jgi:hypothetical protein